ncbi:hypothetical protein XENOCAPTIV_005623 [Xenoophorus captivus]|uniref:Uncharacterized protein n=1 Tax=Xenoophorus captivus TaxID=1517983 RepID=A0ABV0SDH9_9TELE
MTFFTINTLEFSKSSKFYVAKVTLTNVYIRLISHHVAPEAPSVTCRSSPNRTWADGSAHRNPCVLSAAAASGSQTGHNATFDGKAAPREDAVPSDRELSSPTRPGLAWYPRRVRCVQGSIYEGIEKNRVCLLTFTVCLTM